MMPRISSVLYIRVHGGRGFICLREGLSCGFLDGHKITNFSWQQVPTLIIRRNITITVILSVYVVMYNVLELPDFSREKIKKIIAI